jgi:hypothetical protein
MCYSRHVTVHTLCFSEGCHAVLFSDTIAYYCTPIPGLSIPVHPNNNIFSCFDFPLAQDGTEMDKKATNGGYLCRACYAEKRE